MRAHIVLNLQLWQLSQHIEISQLPMSTYEQKPDFSRPENVQSRKVEQLAVQVVHTTL